VGDDVPEDGVHFGEADAVSAAHHLVPQLASLKQHGLNGSKHENMNLDKLLFGDAGLKGALDV